MEEDGHSITGKKNGLEILEPERSDTDSPMEGGRARRSLAAVAAVIVLGFAVCCAIIAGWTAPQGGRAVLESLDADEAKVAGLTVAAPPCPR